jgi:hypothetical protein
MNTNIDTNDDTITSLRLTPIYPSITLVGSLPTVNGVSYYSWTEALAAKAAGVTYITTDIFGRVEASAEPERMAA